jgi:NitT/TauT family transport system substrate-binding protein
MKAMNGTDRSNMRRRTFLAGVSALSAGSLLPLPRIAAAEPPPEIKKIRLVHAPAICLSPQYLAEEFLRFEGFTEIEYVQLPMNKALGPVEAGQADMTMGAAPDVVAALDAGRSVLPLAGIHAGCYELFVNGRVASVKDLKGRSVVVTGEQSTERLFLSSIVAYIGVSPRDIDWVNARTGAEAMQTFIDGKVDAFFAFAPEPQELRARKVGRVILSTTHDRPWSQYFCCMVNARRGFAEAYPSATRRALRAFLKAADVCARDPETAARYLAAKGYEPRYEMALEIVRDLPYRRWRDADPEDTLRFHALRLHEAGIIKTTPGKLIAEGTDWRFLNGLKQELKA